MNTDRYLRAFICILLVWISSSATAIATKHDDKKGSEENKIELTAERVVVFKDGYCLVVKSATAKTDKQGKAFTDDVPEAAVLGSFWAISDDSEIQSMVAGWKEFRTKTGQETFCREMIEFIQANKDKTCRFLIGEQRFSGVIGEALREPTPENPPESTSGHGSVSLQTLSGSHPVGQSHFTSIVQPAANAGHHFVLKTPEGETLIDARQVTQLQVDELATRFTRETNTNHRLKRLTLQFDRKNADVEFRIIYFRPGVRWIPTYRIDLDKQLAAGKKVKGKEKNEEQTGDRNVEQASDNKLAHISLQGELINEAEDLVDMPIDVVVGVPNFRFRDVPSPLVLESVMINALNRSGTSQATDGFNANSFSNAMYAQRSSDFSSSRANGNSASAEMDIPAELTGSAGNDLFVYHLPKMTLRRGERATVPIMNTQVRYRDVYTWDVQIKHDDSYVPSNRAGESPLILADNKVWRQVELINDTEFPWTTGPAMFMDGFQPLAQELLTYTSPGGICRVPVTVSVDLRGKAEDSETSRDPEHLKWNGHRYARVHGRTELELANNKQVPVPVEVRLTFGGVADKTSDDGETTVHSFRKEDWENYRGETAVNNSTTVLWKTSVDPGECFKPTVDYHFFLYH